MPINLLLGFLIGAAGFIAFLLWFELAAEKRDLKKYPAPGRLASSRQLHILEKGEGSPVVILESGLVATSVSWLLTQQAIAQFARVVAYDRAGLGWSVPSQAPLSLSGLLSDLDEVVKATSPNAPVLLVGHSFGGLLVGAYAHLHPEKVSGVVLVDPVSLQTYASPDRHQAQRIAFAIRLSRRGAFLARLGVVRGALALVARGHRQFPVWIGKLSAGKGSDVMSRLATEIAKLPPETHGPIRSHWSRPLSFQLLAQYLDLLPDAAHRAQTMPIPAQAPVVVLSAATATSIELAERNGWTSRHTQIPNTTHWIQLDRPDRIAESVKELIIE